MIIYKCQTEYQYFTLLSLKEESVHYYYTFENNNKPFYLKTNSKNSTATIFLTCYNFNLKKLQTKYKH